jgi:hypothetical protein
MDKIVIALTPDSNKVHFLTNVTSLLIPQRMDSFNKEKKVNTRYTGWFIFYRRWQNDP